MKKAKTPSWRRSLRPFLYGVITGILAVHLVWALIVVWQDHNLLHALVNAILQVS